MYLAKPYSKRRIFLFVAPTRHINSSNHIVRKVLTCLTQCAVNPSVVRFRNHKHVRTFLFGAIMARRKVLTRENAEALAKRDGGYFCHYCGKPIQFPGDIPKLPGTIYLDPSIDALEVDHKVPKAKGGSDDLDNLLLSCTKCNQRKGKKDYSDFLKWLKR